MRFYQVLLVVVVVLVVVLSEGADVQPSCGRVAGDQDIPPGRWPWFARLYVKQDLFCSGSLISDQWVLTRADCFKWVDSSAITGITVVLGRTNQTGSNPKEVSRGITQTVCHPLFSATIFDNDICLAKLSSPVESSDHISPVCLAAETSTFPNGTFSSIAGPLRGDREKLGELQLQILGDNECRSRSLVTITENMICTRDDPPREEQPCLETKGGSLLVRSDDLVWIQAGVSLFSVICRKFPSPPFYTRVSRYQEWISNVTGSSQPGFVTFPSSGDDGVSTSTRSPPRTNTNTTIVPHSSTWNSTTVGSSEKLSSTFFTSVLALLSSLVVLLV